MGTYHNLTQRLYLLLSVTTFNKTKQRQNVKLSHSIVNAYIFTIRIYKILHGTQCTIISQLLHKTYVHFLKIAVCLKFTLD